MNSEDRRSSLDLSAEQYKDIEHLAAINYDLQKIAMYLDVDYLQLLDAFNQVDSKVKYHYDRGQLITQAEIDKANLKRAKDGNMTSIQQWKKDSTAQKIENYKKKVIFDKEMREYEQLQGLIERGETKNVPAILVDYFEQIDFIRCLFNKYNSKSYILSAVRLKWPKISMYQANKLYMETLNFFNLDNGVKVEAWANIYADRLDNLALIATEMNDLETARRLNMDAAALRGVGKEQPHKVPDELLDRRPVIYTMKIEQIGVQAADRNELAKFIDCLPEITEKEKSKFRREAMIQDVPFELVEDAEG